MLKIRLVLFLLVTLMTRPALADSTLSSALKRSPGGGTDFSGPEILHSGHCQISFLNEAGGRLEIMFYVRSATGLLIHMEVLTLEKREATPEYQKLRETGQSVFSDQTFQFYDYADLKLTPQTKEGKLTLSFGRAQLTVKTAGEMSTTESRMIFACPTLEQVPTSRFATATLAKKSQRFAGLGTSTP